MRHENDPRDDDSGADETSATTSAESSSGNSERPVKRGAMPTPRSAIENAPQFVPEPDRDEGGEGQEERSGTGAH